MRKLTILTLTIWFCSFSYGQTVTELYSNKKFKELVKLENKADKLTQDELYIDYFGKIEPPFRQSEPPAEVGWICM